MMRAVRKSIRTEESRKKGQTTMAKAAAKTKTAAAKKKAPAAKKPAAKKRAVKRAGKRA
jgi:hypothetical protein